MSDIFLVGAVSGETLSVAGVLFCCCGWDVSGLGVQLAFLASEDSLTSDGEITLDSLISFAEQKNGHKTILISTFFRSA